jgi:hypothetical protein
LCFLDQQAQLFSRNGRPRVIAGTALKRGSETQS